MNELKSDHFKFNDFYFEDTKNQSNRFKYNEKKYLKIFYYEFKVLKLKLVVNSIT